MTGSRLRLALGATGVVLAIAASSPAGAATPAAASHGKATFGLPGVQQLTATSGTSVHPTLRWKPVSGAANYRVVVRDRSGKVAWAWSGPTTKVVMSATTKPVGHRPGQPRLTSGASWTVAASDAAGKPLALSRPRAISP